MSTAKAPWMLPGAPRAPRQPSWLRMRPYVEAAEPAASEFIEQPVRMPSMPPPTSSRPSLRPSTPPPSSHRASPQIQTTRELELESEVAALHNEMAQMQHQMQTMQARVIEESEPAVVALALAIAKRVVGREVDADPGLLKAWIDEALGVLPAGEVTMNGDSATVREGDSVIEVGPEARMAAIADALGVT